MDWQANKNWCGSVYNIDLFRHKNYENTMNKFIIFIVGGTINKLQTFPTVLAPITCFELVSRAYSEPDSEINIHTDYKGFANF